MNAIIIEKISCSQNHSVLLSSDGDIYTNGFVGRVPQIRFCKKYHIGYNSTKTEVEQFQRIPIKINELTDIKTKKEKTESSKTKLFCENKFIDIATHSQNISSIALSVNGTYYVWWNSYFSDLVETDFKSFDEIFVEEYGITAKAIHIQSDNKFTPNNKYLNKFEEISEIGSGSYGKVFEVKLKSSLEFFSVKKIVITDEKESLKELCTSLLISELNSDLIVRYHDVWYENDFYFQRMDRIMKPKALLIFCAVLRLRWLWGESYFLKTGYSHITAYRVISRNRESLSKCKLI
jgi:alpha-tubulin suppressor-like RCC1 family protein